VVLKASQKLDHDLDWTLVVPNVSMASVTGPSQVGEMIIAICGHFHYLSVCGLIHDSDFQTVFRTSSSHPGWYRVQFFTEKDVG
jgi:hypothetical protein